MDTPPWSRDRLAERRGRFILGPELGRGGMGIVHMAWDPLLKRLVALKQLLHADPLKTLRFLREAQLQAKVEHPHVCKVYEVSAEGDKAFIAMQCVEGRPLGEVHNLHLREKVRIFAEVANALHAAHRLGLIHGDLKPSNILLEHHGEAGWIPCLLDFGLARDLASADLTLTWGLAGTPAFMSPEQAAGENLTPAADLYSLGATFYAVFGGRPPFEATTLVGLLARQSQGRPPSLRRTRPDFPRDLEIILLKCLERDPGRRYASAFALEEDLRRWLAGAPILARPVGWPEHVWRWTLRRRALSLSIAASTLFSVSLLAWNVHSARVARAQIERAQRFSLQVREVEQLLRIERMLPVHDMRPAEARVRERMEDIRATMARMGPVGAGPGHYALGRGHATLGEYEIAHKHLLSAWEAGHQTSDVASALGSVLLEWYTELRTKHPYRSDHGGEAEVLRATYAEPGLAWLRRSGGSAQGSPAYGEALVAFVEQDMDRCCAKCQEALKARPWMYEALILQATAWIQRTNQAVGLGITRTETLGEAWSHLDKAKEALDQAARLAPSDVRVQSRQLLRITTISVLQTDSGRPESRIFQEGDQHFRVALAIRPDDLELFSGWIFFKNREAMTDLRRGLDPAPRLGEVVARSLPFEARLVANQTQQGLATSHWLLADAAWRHGRDPWPHLREMERLDGPRTYDLGLFLNIAVEHAIDRGMDPRPWMRRMEAILRPFDQDRSEDYYHNVIWAQLLLPKADWEWETGQDPETTLREGMRRLERSTRIQPRAVHPWNYLTQFRSRMALRALVRGEDPEPWLREALSAGLQAQSISRAHFRTHLALSEVRLLQGLAQQGRGEDPRAVLSEGTRQVAAGLRENPTDFRLHLLQAALELAAFHAAPPESRDSAALDRAEAACRAGLATKPDAARLHALMARIFWAKAEMHAEEGTHWKTQARECAAAALRIRPGYREALFLQGLSEEAPHPPRLAPPLEAPARAAASLGYWHGWPCSPLRPPRASRAAAVERQQP